MPADCVELDPCVCSLHCFYGLGKPVGPPTWPGRFFPQPILNYFSFGFYLTVFWARNFRGGLVVLFFFVLGGKDLVFIVFV